MPHRGSLPLNWRRKAERYRMKATKCETCGAVFFPPRFICPDCRRKGKIVCTEIPKQGTLYTYTVLHSAPEGFENYLPYIIGVVDLNGTKITGMLTGIEPDELEIGMPLKPVFRKICEGGKAGLIHYSFKFTKASP